MFSFSCSSPKPHHQNHPILALRFVPATPRPLKGTPQESNLTNHAMNMALHRYCVCLHFKTKIRRSYYRQSAPKCVAPEPCCYRQGSFIWPPDSQNQHTPPRTSLKWYPIVQTRQRFEPWVGTASSLPRPPILCFCNMCLHLFLHAFGICSHVIK